VKTDGLVRHRWLRKWREDPSDPIRRVKRRGIDMRDPFKVHGTLIGTLKTSNNRDLRYFF
jgi:hypothetical protein